MGHYYVANARDLAQWTSSPHFENGHKTPFSQRYPMNSVAAGPSHVARANSPGSINLGRGRGNDRPRTGGTRVFAQQRPSGDGNIRIQQASTSLPMVSSSRTYNLDPSSLYNDPAFSNDPNHHPDQFALFEKPKQPILKAREPMVPDESPPPYELSELEALGSLALANGHDDDTPSSSHGSRPDHSHVDDSDSAWDPSQSNLAHYIARPRTGATTTASTSAASTSPSSPDTQVARMPSPSLSPSPSPSLDDDDEESSLPYLRDDPPQRSGPVVYEEPDELTDPSPRALRTRSNPLPEVTIDSQAPTRRGFSLPHFQRVPGLDRIDELDETNPYGTAWHHGGRYDVARPQFTMQHPAYPSGNERLTQRDQPNPYGYRPMVPPAGPPAAVPFKINLKPGEIFVRPPPDAYNQANAPRQPLAPIHPPHPPLPQHSLPGQGIRERPARSSRPPPDRNEVTGDIRPYTDQTPRSQQSSRYTTPASSPDTSGFTPPFTPPVGLSPDIEIVPWDGHRTQDFHALPTSTSGTPPMSPRLHGMLTGSHASTRPSTINSRMDGPPSISGASRHLPKKLVMPAPLQQLPNPYGEPPTQQPRAIHIPVRDGKKGNLLKKRATTTGGRTQGIATTDAPGVSDQKTEKAPRRLSKRKSII